MYEGTLLLSADAIASCLTMEDVIADVELAFRAHGLGKVAMPAKISLNMSAFGLTGWINAMPAYVADAGMCGIKWAGGFVDNSPRHGLPYVMATMILNDPETGLPLAVMDGTVVTNLRTGAVAAVAAKFLARDAGPSTVAILGAGTQGRTSLLALSTLRALAEVRVLDVRPQAAEAFRNEMAPRVAAPIRICATGDEAVAGADVIVTATTANTPLFSAGAAMPGAFVASLGSYAELDPDLVTSAKIVVDSLDQNLHRGELVPLLESGRLRERDVYAELGDIVAGKRPGRASREERIVGCLIGMASEDIAVAATAYRRAAERGLGQRFRFM
jgi:alanine dehydrogenase